MTRLLSLAVAVVLSISTLVAQTSFSLTDKVRFSPDVKVGKLSSGIPYYIMKNSRPAKRAELMLVVNAGAVLEENDQNGLAHFCEHMAFNGTQNFPKLELVNFLESLGVRFGADLNAYTNADETVYMITVPLDRPTDFIKGIQVLSDWAGNVTYADADIDAERGVVMEEWRLGKGAEARVNDKHRPFIYYKSKYAERDVIGDTNVLLRAPGENLRRFYRTWYRPEHMSIVIVGDIDAVTVEQYLQKYFANIPSSGERPSQRPQIILPSHKETLISIASDIELTQASAELYIKRLADTVRTYADYKQQITTQLAFEMLNGRLQELTRKNPPPFASAATGTFSLAREARATYGTVSASDKNVLKSLNALLTEVERVKRHGYTETELARAKDALMSFMEKYYNERDKSESQQFAQELTRHILTRESVPGIAHEWEIYQTILPQITVDDVKQAAAAMFGNENRVVTISVPEGNGYTKPTEQQVRDLMAAVEAKKIAAYVDNVPTKPLMDVPPTAGKITGLRTIKEIDATELTLSNGARIVYKKTDFKNDEILFSAQSWGGRSLSAEADNISTMVATEVIDNGGLAGFSANDLTKMLSGKTIAISPSVTMEQDLISGSSTPKDLRTFFELLHLGFTQPRKDPEAFAAWKTSMKANLANKEKSPEAVFFDTIMAVATNNHPRVRSMSESDVDKIDLDKAFEFFRQRYAAASDFTFYFVGNFDEEMLKTYCETYIASLPSSPTKEQWKDVGIRSRKGQFRKTVYKGVEPKSFVVLSASGPLTYGPRERYDVLALCEVMEIQLREQMREEKGGVYFVSVIPNFTRIPTQEYSVSVMFSCAPDRANELITVVKNEMASLRSNTVPDSLVAKVREMQTKERETGMKTNRFWLNVMSSFDRDSEPYSNLALRDELIAKLTPEQIRKAAATYLTGANFAEFVLKPESDQGKDPADTPTPTSAPAGKKGKK